MTVEFHNARRRPSLAVVGLAGPSGSGKSFSALRLARGLAGNGRFHVIDTENGKSEQLYGDMFGDWACAELTAPFTPERYVEAIEAALADGATVLVIDSISDEHDGDGGLLDIQEEYLEKKAGGNAARREALSFPAWKAAKQRHKRLVREFRAPRCHLIVCMRAQDKIELVKNDKGKLEAIPKRSMIGVDGWEPICEKRFPYELLASFLMLPNKPGVPRPIKLPESYRSFIPLDQQIDEATGAALAAWAAGDAAPSGEHDEQIARLTDELLACADVLGNRTQVNAAVAKNRRANSTHPEKHVEWLSQQASRLADAVAAREQEQIEIPNEEEVPA